MRYNKLISNNYFSKIKKGPEDLYVITFSLLLPNLSMNPISNKSISNKWVNVYIKHSENYKMLLKKSPITISMIPSITLI